jgi:branched-chain amino acid transport system substrate-binding protein
MQRTIAAALIVAGTATGANAVEIGVINSLSGNFSTFGERYRTGIQVALDEVNANGGINGEELTLNVQDDRSEARPHCRGSRWRQARSLV